VNEVEADLLVPVAMELMRTGLRQEPHFTERVGCLEFLEPSAEPTGHRPAEFPDHPVT
jgi:hypothetical protein